LTNPTNDQCNTPETKAQTSLVCCSRITATVRPSNSTREPDGTGPVVRSDAALVTEAGRATEWGSTAAWVSMQRPCIDE